MISNLYHPIFIFNLEDFGIDLTKYTEYLKPLFFDLEWDWYLYRQQKLEYLIKNALDYHVTSDLNKLFCAYYKGEINETKLTYLTEFLNTHQLEEFQKIKTTRRRAMQAFKVYINDTNINIMQACKQNFTQSAALTLNEGTDWRRLGRIFREPPECMVTEELRLILKYLVKKIISHHPTLGRIDLFVHFTQIVAHLEQTATNSPEGIHQDGMDYIVSALVIDRENVCGGKSVIYDTNDSEKDFLEVTLRKGWGILQPDKGSDLWHIVEPISPMDITKPAYRSTIGIDFSFS